MPKKILVVDDEREFVNCLSEFFIIRGYNVDAAFDGLQAVIQVKKAKPDLVILDIKMPAGGGFQVLEKIRDNFKTFNLPVIVITAKTDDETKAKAEKLGISAYFSKPVDMPGLLEKVTSILAPT